MNLLAMQKTQVQSLGREHPLEKEMAAHSSILACEITWTQKVDANDRLTLSLSPFILEEPGKGL